MHSMNRNEINAMFITDIVINNPKNNGVAKGRQLGQLPPVGVDSDKLIVGSVVHAAELNWK